MTCCDCGEEMKLLTREGRTRKYKNNVQFPIPSDFPIPTCPSCGDELWSVEMGKAMDELYNAYIKGMRVHARERDK